MSEQIEVRFASSESGDWTAMYVNGKKVAEGHSLSESEVAQALGFSPKSVRVPDKWAEERGFPEHSSGLPRSTAD